MAIWNPAKGTYEEEDDNQIWNPKNGSWVNADEMNKLEQSSKQEKESKKKQDSFSSTSKNLLDTVKNSAVKNHGFSLSNVITDIANFGEGLKDTVESVPLIGSTVKFGNKALSSAANIATNMGEGALRTGEGILDFATKTSEAINNNIEYQMNKVFLGKDKAKETYERKKKDSRDFISRDLTTELLNKTGYNDEEFHKNFEKGSIVRRDNLGGQIAQGIGGMVPSLLAGQYLGLGTEIPTKALEGLKGLNKVKTVASNIGKQAVANLGSTSTLGMSTYGQSLQDAYQNGATDEEATRYAIGSTVKEIATEWITGGIPGLKGVGGLDKPVGELINKSTGKLKNEYAKAIAKSLMNYGYKFVGEGLEEGLSEIIDPYLKNATYSKDEKVNWEDVLNNFIIGGITGGILEVPNSIADFNNNMVEANNNIQQNKPILPTGQINPVQQSTEGNPLIESNTAMLPLDKNTLNRLNNQPNLGENIQSNINAQVNQENVLNQDKNAFVYEPSDNPKIDNLRKSTSQFMNNSNDTKAFVETVEKVISDKNYNITFDNTVGDNVNGRIAVNENGEVDIRINPNSDRAGEFILTHEITHAIETKEMTDLVIDYASKNKDFNDALNSLKEVYGTDEVNAEVLADISGQLFGNQEFINTLSMKKPSIFKKIYNSIISLANKITGNSKESLFLKDLKNKWEKAYRESNNSLGNGEEYSLFGKAKNNNISKLSDESVLEIQEKTRSNQKNKDNVKFIAIDEILPFKKNGGYRSSEEVSKLTNNIIANGIENPIEVKNGNNQLEIYNGNHRLEIARKLGLKEVPITFINENVESDINSLYNETVSSYIEGEDNGNITRTKKSKESNDKSGNNIRYSLDDSKQFSIESRISRNGGLSDTLLGHNDGASSYSASSENDTSKAKGELENGSFSFDESAKNYDDLKKTKNIEFFKKDNGDVEVHMLDSNSNLVNDFSLISKKHAIQALGKSIGEYIYDSSDLDSKTINIGNDINDMGMDTDSDYFMNHRPSEDFGDASNFESNMDGIFEHPEWFLNMDEAYNRESLDSLRKVRNNPEAEIKIYRATPGNKINPGDWITPSKKYAEEHNNRQFDGKGNVLEMTVKAKDILFAGDDINEFGYFPGNSKYSKNGNKWQQFVENNFKSRGTKTNFENLRKKEFKITDISTANSWLKSLHIDDYVKAEKRNGKYVLFDNEFDTVYKSYESVEDFSKNIFKDINSEFGKFIKNNVKTNSVDLGNSILEYKDVAKEATKEVKKSRREVQHELLCEMGIKVDDIQVGNDISSLNFQRTDPIRVNEKVFGSKIGRKINEATIYKTKENTAKKIRWQNEERNSLKELGIKSGSKESAAVQKYGEKRFINKYGEVSEYGDIQLANEFPDVKVQEKIKKAAKIIRGKYDKYLDITNNILTEMGYDQIPKREDYMRHFSELTDIFSKIGIPFNLNEIRANDLPTDINGLTENNRPGRSYFASAQHRTGLKTTYDAIKGIDGYIESAGNLIFHTADIQRYRALSKMIRNTYGQVEGLKNIENLTEAEFVQRVKDIQNNKLSKYVAWLDEQANSLAGKKGAIDRGTERFLGRRGYSILNRIKSQVGSNMTGFNFRSSLTNFISTTLAASKTNKLSLVKGTAETINNIFHPDDFINNSNFLTARFGSNSLSSTPWQKISNAGQILMSGSDWFASNMIVRSKYYEGLSKGMSKTNAMKYADDFGARVLGDRSQGSTAEVFNSKTLGLLTQFQLEVNNQWDYMMHDSKIDFQNDKKQLSTINAGTKMLFSLGQMAVYSHLANELFKNLTGSEATFDPIEIFKAIFGFGEEYEDEKLEDRLEIAKDLLIDNLPFASVFTGGRIPIQEALPVQELLTGQDKYGREKSRIQTILETLPYYFLPTGYSQIKKTKNGIEEYKKSLNPLSKDFLKDRNRPGSYTDKGKLRFEAKTDPISVGKNILFGQYSSEEAQKYFNNGYLPIDPKTLEKLDKKGVSVSEYRKYSDDSKKLGLSEIKSDKDSNNKPIKGTASAKKALAIMNSSYSEKEKNYLLSTLSNSDDSVTVEEISSINKDYKSYKFYFSLDKAGRKKFHSELDELNISQKKLIDYYDTRREYKDVYTSIAAKDKIMDYINNLDLDDNVKWHLYSKDYGGDNLKSIADRFNIKYKDYYNATKYVNDISVKYGGTNNSSRRKTIVFNYINNLKLNKVQKSILFKQVGYSDSSSKRIVFDYINSLNISKSEKQKLYNSIY